MEANDSRLKRLSDRRLLTVTAIAAIVLQLLLFPALTQPVHQLLWIAILLGLVLIALLPIWRARVLRADQLAMDRPVGTDGAYPELKDDLLRWQRLVQTIEQVAGIGFWEMPAATSGFRWSSGALSLLTPLAPTQDFLPWLDAHEADELAAALERGWQQGQAFTCEFTLQPPGRPQRRLRLIGQPQRNSEDGLIGMAGALFDVSPLHAAEQRCHQLTQRLLDLSRILSSCEINPTQRLESLGVLLLQSVGASALVLPDAEALPDALRRLWMPHRALASWGGSEGLAPYLIGRTEETTSPLPFAMVEEGEQRLLRCRLERAGEKHSWLLLLDPQQPPLDEVDDVLLGLMSAIFADLLDRHFDVEALGALRQQVEDQLRQKSELMGSLSHEVGSPLSGITNVLRALEEGQFGALDERHRRLLATSANTGQHINELISDLLDAARLEAGQLSLQRQLCDLGEIAADAIERCKTLAAEKQQRLELRERQPCLAHVDPQRGLQMLVQLIGNAIKYTPTGGTIWVSVRRRHDGRPSLSVCDTGVGIRRRAHTDIVRPFVREESPYARPGWGLALAMADMVATLHQARLRIHSRGGRGSRTSIDLPRARRRTSTESH